MRKLVRFSNCALVLIVGLAMSVDAHVGDRVYPFFKLTDEMVAEIQLHDGSVEEWYELIGEPTLTLLDFASMHHGTSRDPSDMDFRIWLAWHDDPARIYVAFASADNDYFSEYGDPAIQLAIDGDHGGGAGCPCEDPVEALGETQLYLAVARTGWGGPTLDDTYIRFATGQLAWNALPPYGEGGGNAGGENPVISVIEFYVTPFDRFGRTDDSPALEGSVVSDLVPGQVIGFALLVQDVDHSRSSNRNWHLVFWVPESMPGPMRDEWRSGLSTNQTARGDFLLDGLLLPAQTRRYRGRVGFLGTNQGLD